MENIDNYNAHPSQKLPVIKSYTNGKALELCEWGLIPGWSKKLDKFSPLINARRETLMEKVTFRILSRHQGVLFQLMAIMSGKEKIKQKSLIILPKKMMK